MLTLRCQISGSLSGWTYLWFSGTQRTPVESSPRYTNTLTVSAVSQQYWCQALPHASLTVEPHWSPIYTGETVSLRCGLSGGYTDWQYHWYKDGKRIEDAQPAGHTVTGDKLSITAVSVSDGGKYHCEGQRADRPLSSQRSDPVSLSVSGECLLTLLKLLNTTLKVGHFPDIWNQGLITPLHRNGDKFDPNNYWGTCVSRVRPRPFLTVSPLGQIFEGDSVTLRCEVTEASAGWRYYWYRAGQSRAGLDNVWYNDRWVYLQPLSDSSSGAGGTFTISAVTGTHRGLYWCRAGRGDTPYYTQYSGAVTLTVSGE
ncbi:Fc receptor-like protein 2 [Amia ocellicauda]|uniref:Fc receptor-like protein 2 n=1 Tax=Amia ocellicauda TaxID=2972642 RepID=UPI00346475D3